MRYRTLSASLGLVVAIALVGAAPGVAQESDPDDTKECFRAQGWPRCDTSLLLDFGMAQPRGPYSGDDVWIGGAVGMLWNIGPEYGFGGKFFLDKRDRFFFRLEGRARWFEDRERDTIDWEATLGFGFAFGGN